MFSGLPFILAGTLRVTLCIFLATPTLFRALKDGLDPLPPLYLLRVVYLILHTDTRASVLRDVTYVRIKSRAPPAPV